MLSNNMELIFCSDSAGDSSETMKLRKQVAEYTARSEKDAAKIQELQQGQDQGATALRDVTESLRLSHKKYSQLETDHQTLTLQVGNIKKELEVVKDLADKREVKFAALRTDKSKVLLFSL